MGHLSLLHRLRDIIDELRLMLIDVRLLGIDYFVIKARYWRAAGIVRFVRVALATVAGGAVLVMTLYSCTTILYSAPWAGFGAFKLGSGEAIPAKTLWDWMDLLIVPLAIAIVAYLFRLSESASSRGDALERAREQALNNYLDRMQDILLDADLDNQDVLQDSSRVATARTIALLRQLDGQRKAIVLRFLYEAGLISGNPSFVDLRRSDLSGIQYEASSLSGSNLGGANLDHSSFEWTWLSDAHLSGASMIRATLSSAYLTNANLEYVLLQEADLYSANLESASLIKAKAPRANLARANLEGAVMRDIDLTGANMRKVRAKGAYMLGARMSGANLRNADLRGANLTEANLMYAALSGADLTGANLTNAIISRSQLNRARSYDGANLDGIRDRLGSPRMPTAEDLQPPKAPPFRASSDNGESAPS